MAEIKVNDGVIENKSDIETGSIIENKILVMTKTSDIFCEFVLFCINFVIGIYYSIGYQDITPEFRNDTISRWLLFHTVFTWILIGCSFKVLAMKVWFHAQLVPASFIEDGMLIRIRAVVFCGSFITSSYFLHKFINHTIAYSNSPCAQNAINIIVICFSINLSLIGLLLCVVVIAYLCFWYSLQHNTKQNTDKDVCQDESQDYPQQNEYVPPVLSDHNIQSISCDNDQTNNTSTEAIPISQRNNFVRSVVKMASSVIFFGQIKYTYKKIIFN